MSEVNIVTPTKAGSYMGSSRRIFLAGTIDMGNSVDWQNFIYEQTLKSADKLTRDVVFFNPRRSEGFNNDVDDIGYQINWELVHLEEADLIFMYIKGDSKSPISLLELGLFARTGKLVVCCEPNFYRFDNVQVTCDFYDVPLYSDINTMFQTHILREL